MMKLACAALGLVLTTAAVAQTPTTTVPATPAPAVTTGAAQTMATIPGNSMTVTEWYKQNVYDPQDNKIGEIMDVLMDRGGKATALIIGVGGFLGAGEKDVAVPFSAIQFKSKNNKPYLVMNATKDQLKSAKGFKYDRNALNWVPAETTGTTGQGRR